MPDSRAAPPGGSLATVLKRLFVGRPFATTEQEHQRIPKTIALAVFSSDAISSTAYAAQEMLLVIALFASLSAALDTLVPIAIAVAVLLALVASSYRQTIFEYPNGGGSYVVSRENLGETPSLVAGGSLLVDYILTVAVSICAGVRAITSIPALSGLTNDRVVLCLIAIGIITLANLRGVRESGRLFAAPTYLYIFSLIGLIFFGLTKSYLGWFGGVGTIPVEPYAEYIKEENLQLFGGTLTLFIVLKGFSSGAVALSGVEAISNGVPAFRRPESRNASTTLVWMALILGSTLFGVCLLASRLHPFPFETGPSVFSQMGLAVFGNGPMYLILQFATAGILLLAANTAYADFPRLSSIIAKDGFLPRQLANRGDRLVFSNGVILLALAAATLVVIFGGNESALIPLYAVGVFTSFTLSQAGMVRHHMKEHEPGWRRKMAINGVGACATLLVTLVVATTKFTSGAWVSILVVAVVFVLFRMVHAHYRRVGESLRVPEGYRPPRQKHTVVVLVGRVHTGVLQALSYARSLNPDHLVAMTVVSDEEEQHRIDDDWAKFGLDVPLEIVYSPYRELTKPTLRFIDELDQRWDDDFLTVVIPEFVVRRWWEHLLHNQSALILKGRLLFRKGTVVTSVPYHVK